MGTFKEIIEHEDNSIDAVCPCPICISQDPMSQEEFENIEVTIITEANILPLEPIVFSDKA